MDVERTLVLIEKYTPEAVQVICGKDQKPGIEILNELPGHVWDTILPVIYGDFITKIQALLNDTIFDPYAGSATGKFGSLGRCGVYDKIKQGSRKPARGSKHEELFAKPEFKIHLVLLTIFNPRSPDAGLYSLVELGWSSYFGCHKGAKMSSWSTKAAVKLSNAATPPRFGELPWNGLNNAVQSLQGIVRKSELKPCVNCKSQKMRSARYETDGLTFGAKLCAGCYSYKKRHDGQPRPLKLIQMDLDRTENVPHHCQNPVCGVDISDKKRRWSISEEAWLCVTCYTYREREGVNRPAEHVENRKKDNLPLPVDLICQRSGCDAELLPKKRRFWKPKQIWLCNPCTNKEKKAEKEAESEEGEVQSKPKVQAHRTDQSLAEQFKREGRPLPEDMKCQRPACENDLVTGARRFAKDEKLWICPKCASEIGEAKRVAKAAAQGMTRWEFEDMKAKRAKRVAEKTVDVQD